MPSAFTLYGQLIADTGAFEKSLRDADDRLSSTRGQLSKTMQESLKLGDTSATVARRYEKLNEAITTNRERLNEVVAAYSRGEISAKKYASVLAQVERATTGVNSRINDAKARVTEIGETGATHFQNQIKGATSAISNLSAIFTGNRLSGATTEISAVGNALTALPGPAGLATAAIAATVTAAVGLGAALFALEVRASEYGSKIHDAAQATGLSTETISTLKFAADNASSSLEQIQTGLGRFSKTVGAAADGSKEAAAKLSSLGIDPQKALGDLDGALDQVFHRIADAKPGIEQVTLAQKAFGKSGADLIPVILQAGGSLENYRALAEKLGITLNQDAANAADAFGDSLGQLKAQAEAAAAHFALQFAPEIQKAIESVSAILADSKGAFEDWGRSVSNAFKGFEFLSNFVPSGISKIIEATDALKAALILLGGPISAALYALGDLGEKYDEFLGNPDKEKKLNEKFQKRNEEILRRASAAGNTKAADALARLKALQPTTLDEDALPDLPDYSTAATSTGGTQTESDALKKVKEKLDNLDKAYKANQAAREAQIKAAQSGENSLLKANYSIQEALLNQHLKIQEASEFTSISETTNLKNKQLSAQIASDKKYYSQLIANAKDPQEATKLQAELADKVTQATAQMRVNSINAFTQIQEKAKELRKTLSDIFLNAVGGDNPFVRIFDEGRKAIERATEATRGLSKGIQDAVLAAVKGQDALNKFGQRISDRVEAAGYTKKAREFKQGFLDENNPRIKAVQDAIDNTQDPQTRKLLQFQLENMQKFQLQSDFQSTLDAIGNLNPVSLKEIPIPKGLTSAADILKNVPNASQVLTDRFSKTALKAYGFLPDPEKQHLVDQQILKAASGLDPAKLNRQQDDIISDAYKREATRAANREDAAAELVQNLNKIITDKGLKIDSSSNLVTIRNEAPKNARVTSNPTSADTDTRYPIN